MSVSRRWIVGLGEASGIAYGIQLLECLKCCVKLTRIAPRCLESGAMRAEEIDLTARDLACLADVTDSNADIGATIASGSFKTLGMVVLSCSVSSLAQIASA